jgi:hypothetical protein
MHTCIHTGKRSATSLATAENDSVLDGQRLIRTYIHKYTYIHTHRQKKCNKPATAEKASLREGQKHIRTYMHLYIHACTHAYIHACIHAYTQAEEVQQALQRQRTIPCEMDRSTYAHTCIYTYMHAHMHTYRHTYMHTHRQKKCNKPGKSTEPFRARWTESAMMKHVPSITRLAER